MRKVLIIVAGAIILGSMFYLTSCVEEDSAYVDCDGSCSYSEPYSNQYASSCYSTLSDCESDTGHSCKNCS